MIVSFNSAETEQLWTTGRSRHIPASIYRVALRKLTIVDTAISLADLRIPPANRLEALKGDRQGQYSIRVNDQYRLCFIWAAGNAQHVELVDYH